MSSIMGPLHSSCFNQKTIEYQILLDEFLVILSSVPTAICAMVKFRFSLWFLIWVYFFFENKRENLLIYNTH